jgi:hypothetical protein
MTKVGKPLTSNLNFYLAVAAAVSSGSDRLEAAAVVGDAGELAAEDRSVLADLAVATVLVAGQDGVPRSGT